MSIAEAEVEADPKTRYQAEHGGYRQVGITQIHDPVTGELVILSTVVLTVGLSIMGPHHYSCQSKMFGGPNDGRTRRYDSLEGACVGHIELSRFMLIEEGEGLFTGRRAGGETPQ